MFEFQSSKAQFAATVVSLLLFSASAKSEQITYSYSATVPFDPESVVGLNGETASQFFDALVGVGVGQTGQVRLIGSFTWETDTQAFNSTASSAGYVNAISGASLIWDGAIASADINEISANAATSEIGYNTDPVTSSCSTIATCAVLGLRFTPTGNVIQLFDDTDFFTISLVDGNRLEFVSRDYVAFAVGYTDSTTEFIPPVRTETFGDVNVGGVASVFISTEDASINSNTSIPASSNFLDFDDLDSATLSIEFNSDNLISGQLDLTGEITGFAIATVFCNGQAVTVDISNGDTPTSGPDVIVGTNGADVINGMGGDDIICGLGGNDTINAGRGNDWVDAGPGHDTVEGGNGDDEIYGDSGVDILNGGPNNDEIYGEADGDFINGNSGDDFLDGGFGVDQLRGGSGDDVINTGSGGNRGSGLVVTGGGGNDIITGGPGTDEIRGESGNDTILGGDASDSLFGGGGNDIVNGQDGNDILRGNGGKDTVIGGDGNDDMDGGDSDDIMSGGDGNDVMRGATGNDEMSGGAGDDELFGGGGSDILNGNRGDDELSGGGSNDTLNGGSGSDSCDGEGGIDTDASCEGS